LLLRSLSAADDLELITTKGAVLGWAVVFGASQQLLTRLTDRRAQTVLRAVRSWSRKHPNRSDGGDRRRRRSRSGPRGRRRRTRP
jgi:hypothetical protein